jgi:hypothetical protein
MSGTNYEKARYAFDYLDFDVKRINQNTIWSQMINRLGDSVRREGVDTLILLGQYGYGKTFILHKLSDVLSGKTKAKVPFDLNNVVSCRINITPSEPKTKIGLTFVTSIFKNIGMSKLEEIGKKMELKHFKLLDIEMKRVFNRFKEGTEKAKNAAFHWITGESVSEENKMLLMRTGLNDSDKALRFLTQFLVLLKRVGYHSLVVLIDEFEYVVTVYSPRKVNQMMHMFRHIYDEFAELKERGLTLANLIFVIAITPTGWDDLTNLEKPTSIPVKSGGAGVRPWLNRVQPIRGRNVFELRPFNREETEMLVIARLEKKQTEAPYKTFPFLAPPFIDLLYEQTKGVPKDIIQICDLVIGVALERGLPEINAENGKDILKTYHLFKKEIEGA